MVGLYYYRNNVFGLKQSSLSDFSVLVYILLFSHPAIFKQTFSLKPILGQHDPNN